MGKIARFTFLFAIWSFGYGVLAETTPALVIEFSYPPSKSAGWSEPTMGFIGRRVCQLKNHDAGLDLKCARKSGDWTLMFKIPTVTGWKRANIFESEGQCEDFLKMACVAGNNFGRIRIFATSSNFDLILDFNTPVEGHQPR